MGVQFIPAPVYRLYTQAVHKETELFEIASQRARAARWRWWRRVAGNLGLYVHQLENKMKCSTATDVLLT